MKKICLFLFLLASFLSSKAFTEVEFIRDCLVHEAYVTQENGNLIIQAIARRPPPDILEEIPNQDNPRFIWIPGYWAWSNQRNDFVWISGVWRYQPSKHQWIPGYWKRFPEGWVWIKGFWSAIKENELVYIEETPPDPIDETNPLPPNPQSAYFWMPGYWKYDPQAKRFSWLSGRWELFQDQVVYVPPRYLWREKGYIFIPGYWDWEMENRGVAYACALIPEDEQKLSFTPTEIVQPTVIMEALFPEWPNYASLFHYHFYFHNNLWQAWGAYPNWWDWSTWWSFTWQDTWWLWWWWTHRSYPSPPWMNAQIASQISPPPIFVVNMMMHQIPPANVTLGGVVGSRTLIQALEKAKGRRSPVLPSVRSQVFQIQHLAEPVSRGSQNLRPTGQQKRGEALRKPFIGPGISQLKTAPQRLQPPPLPTQDEFPAWAAPKAHQMKFSASYKQPEVPINPMPRHVNTVEPRAFKNEQIKARQTVQILPPASRLEDKHAEQSKTPDSRNASSSPEFSSLDASVHAGEGFSTPKILQVTQLRAQPYYEPLEDYPPEFYGYEPLPDLNPKTVPPNRNLPQYRPPSSPFPEEFKLKPRYRVHPRNPYQAPPPSYEHLQTPMQLRHLDTISTEPLPQSNPPGPKVHQFPDQFSNERFK